jgi:hypothetical protein
MTDSTAGTPGLPSGLDALRRFTRAEPPVERCELCGAVLAPEHPHLLERKARRVACSCRACALLFFDQPNGHYLRIPERVLRLNDFAFSDLEWDAMMLPIGLVFFVRDEAGQIGAFYPGPAGIVESLVAVDRCGEQFAAHPLLSAMQPEVEALLVNRIGANHACFLVPIDECFRLAGLIRQNWHGLSGGSPVWAAVAGFFDELQQRIERRRHVRYA